MKNNKKQCPKCGSLNLDDSGFRLGNAENYDPNLPVSVPEDGTYYCNDCKQGFLLVNYPICPQCNSDQVKKSGPYAHLKRPGEPAYSGPMITHYYCEDCECKWDVKV